MESTRAGRAAISLIVVAILTVVLLGSFRPRLIGRSLRAIGFQQSWDVFAPEPIHREVIFDAVIRYADGSETTWRIPRSGPAFPLPSQRWELWQDRIVEDTQSGRWERSARWIVGHHAAPGRVPVEVVLRRRWSDLPPPGLDPALRLWNEFDFYTLDLR